MACSVHSGVQQTTRDELVFYVNGKKIVDGQVDPDTTLLSYLRGKLYLKGAKYSCGEGGCGACTVMLSSYDHIQKKIVHHAINACYTSVCAVHGMAVTTIEGIGSTRTQLHPVQERLAKSHGMQCGFCTPGMIMSMYTLLRNNPRPGSGDVESCLHGNLCRCTGYRPILEAFKTFSGNGCCGNPSVCHGGADEEDGMVSGLTRSDFAPYDPTQEPIFPSELQLNDKNSSGTVKFVGKSTTWIRPTTLKDLLTLKSDIPDAVLVVGNAEVAFNPVLKKLSHKTLVSVAHVTELLQVEARDDAIVLGSSVNMTRVCEVLEKRREELPPSRGRLYAELLGMLQQVGACQLRNVSSFGGNILAASPLSDLIPLLMAAGATATVASVQGGLRTLVLDGSFFPAYRKTCLRSDEILVSITIPTSRENEFFGGYKLKNQAHRRDTDVAMVNAGFRVLFDENTDVIREAALSFGGTGPTVVMANDVTDKMVGRKWNEELLNDVLRMINELPLSPHGGLVEYRRSLRQSFFFKFYLKVLNELCLDMSASTEGGQSVSNFDKSALFDIEKAEHTGLQLYRDVPDGQAATDHIGRPVMIESGYQMVTGEAVFCGDVPHEPGELHMAVLFSTRPHAKVISVDTSAALSLDGVHCYVDATDVPGKNTWPAKYLGDEDVETFATEKVIHVGQPIGGIVAESQQLARGAVKLIKVVYGDQDYILTIEEAIKQKSFFQPFRRVEEGNVAEELEKSDLVVEGELYVGGQSHYYMETQSCIVKPLEKDEMLVLSSTQWPHDVQMQVAETLGVSASKITVKTRRLGGAFGGKQIHATGVARCCAVAAKKTGKPVRLLFGRDDDMQYSGTRHSALAKYKVGCTQDGLLKALDVELYVNGGCTEGQSISIIGKATMQLLSPYKVPALRIVSKACKTNISVCVSMRSAATPTSVAVIEVIMDHVARKTGVAAEKLREMNLSRVGDVPFFHQEDKDIANLQRCWDECLQKSQFHRRRIEINDFNSTNHWKKRGLAVVPLKRLTGFQFPCLDQATALVHVYVDGSVLITHGGIEMGQGLFTKTVQIASHVLRIPPERIHITEMSTDKIPNSSITAASTGTDLNGSAVKIACETLMKRLGQFMEENPNGSWEDWVASAYKNRVSLSASGFFKYPGEISFNWDNPRDSTPSFYQSYGAACCEVEIDCLTGDHQLRRADIVMDAGASLNPALDIGQIEGAFLQGYGLYVVEELRYSRDGKLLTKGPGMYRVPRVGDIPSQLNVTLLKPSHREFGLYSAKSVGESPVHLAFAAFLAIKDAISSARADAGRSGFFRLDSPASSERIRLACADEFTENDGNLSSEDGSEFFVRP